MMKFIRLSLLVIGCCLSALSYGSAGFPEIKIVEPLERESTGGCRNPVADAWEEKGGLDLSRLVDKARMAADKKVTDDSQDDDMLDLPAYLRGDK